MTPKQKYDERKRLRTERLLREEQARLGNYEREQAMDRRMLRFLIAAERIADAMELWADTQAEGRK